MVKAEEPLNEISLNTPAGKHNGLSTISDMKSNPLIRNIRNRDSKNMASYVEERQERISLFLKHKGSSTQEVRRCLTELYRLFFQKHSLSNLRALVKQHLAFVVSLLNSNQTTEASKEIIQLFNENQMLTITNLHEVLLSDYTTGNDFYLSTLKILTLQTILRTKTATAYKDTLLLFFSMDIRYLLKDPKLKVHTVVKLLLNFFTQLPGIKILFGMKFLQYVRQFNLPFEAYVKNMDLETFQKQIKLYASGSEEICKHYLNSFYCQYSKFFNIDEKILLSHLFENSELQKSEYLRWNDISSNVENTKLGNYDLKGVVLVGKECLTGDVDSISTKMKFHKNAWYYLRLDGPNKDKTKIHLMDSVLQCLNTSLKEIECDKDVLLELLVELSECCFDIAEYKRLGNVSNVLFNSFIVFKDYRFVRKAAEIESRIYLMDNERNKRTTRRLIQKFERFLGNIKEEQQRLEIFSLLFNIHMMQSEITLAQLQSTCQYLYLKCYRRLSLQNWITFNRCSEVMLAFFYAHSPLKHISTENWSPISKMLYSCLTGVFDFESLDVNPIPEKMHMLYKYEVLIKAAYCLTVEMSKRSTANLTTIAESYMEKWISKLFLLKDRISLFEIDFVKILCHYLSFNNMERLLLDLLYAAETNSEYFQPLMYVFESYRLKSYIALQLVEKIKSTRDKTETEMNISTMDHESLIFILESRLSLYYWGDDYQSFENLFLKSIPLHRKELYDIENKFNIPVSDYVKTLLFNVDLLMIAAKLHISRNNAISAITESKKALKLAISLLKKIDKLSQGSRLRLIQCLAESYMSLIQIYIDLGISRDCEFYSKELTRVICELGEPTIVFNCLSFLHEYYRLTKQDGLRTETLKKSNKAFEYLDGQSNILGLTAFFFANNEKGKIFESLELFFGDSLRETFLPNYWRLKLGLEVEEYCCPKRYRALNLINKVDGQYKIILSNIEKDPFFKNIFESLLAIPSCKEPPGVEDLPITSNIFETPRKETIVILLSPSPRSSNMAPKGKNMRKSFDRIAAVRSLVRLKQTIESINLTHLRNEQLSRISSLYSLILSLVSNLQSDAISAKDLFEGFSISQLPKALPMYYDKELSMIDSTIYNNYSLLPLCALKDPVMLQKSKLLQAHQDIFTSDSAFNVVSFDICPVTETLVISKTDSKTDNRVHIRIPLNRAFTRDLDSMSLSFIEAKKELSKIIEESNTSTSIEVTSIIKSKEDRKKWWTLRHALDARLERLVLRIENCWFSSFKAFFGPEIINKEYISDFRMKFNQILHQNLPSRKNHRSPESFLQIEDWIIEWIMKLNPHDTNFVSMVEDILYFILDMLLFHGEENAYDEVDFSVMHIKIEEQIRKFQPLVNRSIKCQHTFLIVDGSLHMFPWECLSFFRTISVTRVPSYACLGDLLKRNNYNLFPDVSLNNGVSVILNPHGDLNKTESRFSDKFKNIFSSMPNSSILVNERPTEECFLQKLKYSNVFIYLGHGGGEQYARLNEIKRLDSIAPSFLVGCSSASMGSYGILEPTGTIYTYLLAGCPFVLGNLWDVTDKDIDKFSDSIFQKIGLFEEDHKLNGDQSERIISKAVAQSRDACYLKFLNGAAPVAYGLPMKFV